MELDLSKEWYERQAEREGQLPVTAGVPDVWDLPSLTDSERDFVAMRRLIQLQIWRDL